MGQRLKGSGPAAQGLPKLLTVLLRCPSSCTAVATQAAQADIKLDVLGAVA